MSNLPSFIYEATNDYRVAPILGSELAGKIAEAEGGADLTSFSAKYLTPDQSTLAQVNVNRNIATFRIVRAFQQAPGTYQHKISLETTVQGPAGLHRRWRILSALAVGSVGPYEALRADTERGVVTIQRSQLQLPTPLKDLLAGGFSAGNDTIRDHRIAQQVVANARDMLRG